MTSLQNLCHQQILRIGPKRGRGGQVFADIKEDNINPPFVVQGVQYKPFALAKGPIGSQFSVVVERFSKNGRYAAGALVGTVLTFKLTKEFSPVFSEERKDFIGNIHKKINFDFEFVQEAPVDSVIRDVVMVENPWNSVLRDEDDVIITEGRIEADSPLLGTISSFRLFASWGGDDISMCHCRVVNHYDTGVPLS